MNPAFGSKSRSEMMAKLWRFDLGQHFMNDIETGDFEVDETVMGATDRLFERQSDAQPWTIRIGHSAVYNYDPIFKIACERLPIAHQEMLASQPTITCWENHGGKIEFIRRQQVNALCA
jgi:hypothetical protein